jgi:hypothetical protein
VFLFIHRWDLNSKVDGKLTPIGQSDQSLEDLSSDGGPILAKERGKPLQNTEHPMPEPGKSLLEVEESSYGSAQYKIYSNSAVFHSTADTETDPSVSLKFEIGEMDDQTRAVFGGFDLEQLRKLFSWGTAPLRAIGTAAVSSLCVV